MKITQLKKIFKFISLAWVSACMKIYCCIILTTFALSLELYSQTYVINSHPLDINTHFNTEVTPYFVNDNLILILQKQSESDYIFPSDSLWLYNINDGTISKISSTLEVRTRIGSFDYDKDGNIIWIEVNSFNNECTMKYYKRSRDITYEIPYHPSQGFGHIQMNNNGDICFLQLTGEYYAGKPVDQVYVLYSFFVQPNGSISFQPSAITNTTTYKRNLTINDNSTIIYEDWLRQQPPYPNDYCNIKLYHIGYEKTVNNELIRPTYVGPKIDKYNNVYWINEDKIYRYKYSEDIVDQLSNSWSYPEKVDTELSVVF